MLRVIHINIKHFDQKGLPPNRVGIQKRKRREKEKERRERGEISSCLCTQNNSLFILCNPVKSSPFFGPRNVDFHEKISRFGRHSLAVSWTLVQEVN